MKSIIPPDDTPRKQCANPDCQQWFPATTEYFSIDKKRKSSLNPYCKICSRAKWKTRNPKKFKVSDIPEGHQRCANPNCRAVLPATSEFFCKNKRRANGLCQYCHPCRISMSQKYRHAKHPPKEKEVIPDGYKYCSKCKKVQSLTEFHLNKRRKDGYDPRCKSCRSEQQRANRDQDREYRRNHHKLHAERIRKQRHERYESNKEAILEDRKQYRKNNPEKVRDSLRRYNQTPHGRQVGHAGKLRRRAREKELPGNLTTQEIQAKLKAQGYKCYYADCGFAKFKKRKDGSYIYWLDHTVPVARPECEPRHDVNFTVLTCKSCNMKKWAKLPSEWNGSGRLF